MPDTLAITNYHRANHPATISATVGGFDVWFRSRGLTQAPERGDAFLAVALIPAMYAGMDIDLLQLPPVSATLLAKLDLIQEIWTSWNPELRRVTIRANVAPDQHGTSDRTATFFSGGVDAVYAVLAGGGPREQLVFINGFDFAMTPTDWATATARVERLANLLGGEFETVETNWIAFTRSHRIARSTSHGGCLVAVAHLLAPARMTISSSNSWGRLTPWGTHPLVDPLWSSDLTAIRHFGSDALRAEKVAAIAVRPELLDDLWVCHNDPLVNCGQCTKCSRTMAVLRVLDAPMRGFSTHEGDPIAQYLEAVPRTWEKIYLNELRLMVERQGNNPELLREIDATYRKLSRRVAIRELRTRLFPTVRRATRQTIDLRPWGLGPVPDS
jgi:hypothetical protein